MDQGKCERGFAKFNEGVDATANFIKAMAEPVANLVGRIKEIMPKKKKKTPDITSEVEA